MIDRDKLETLFIYISPDNAGIEGMAEAVIILERTGELPDWPWLNALMERR